MKESPAERQARLRRLADKPDAAIDFSDIPELTAEEFGSMRVSVYSMNRVSFNLAGNAASDHVLGALGGAITGVRRGHSAGRQRRGDAGAAGS